METQEKKQAKIELVAYCGLYCANCKKYQNGKCPGCAENNKATWCKIRSCNIENQTHSCAECKTYASPKDCSKFNNFISRAFEFVFRSDRTTSLAYIRENGREAFALEMIKQDRMVFKK